MMRHLHKHDCRIFKSAGHSSKRSRCSFHGLGAQAMHAVMLQRGGQPHPCWLYAGQRASGWSRACHLAAVCVVSCASVRTSRKRTCRMTRRDRQIITHHSGR